MTTDPITQQAAGAVRTVFRLDLEHTSTYTLELTRPHGAPDRYTVVVGDMDDIVVIPAWSAPFGVDGYSVHPDPVVASLMAHLCEVC